MVLDRTGKPLMSGAIHSYMTLKIKYSKNMVLGFKKQFVNKILKGSKVHTIRDDSHNRWIQGRSVQFATGVRTKNYNQFHSGECLNVQSIEIRHHIGHIEIYIDGECRFEVFHHGLDDIYEWTSDLEDFVRNDGFEAIEEFFKWFNQNFTGKLIHWTDMSY